MIVFIGQREFRDAGQRLGTQVQLDLPAQMRRVLTCARIARLRINNGRTDTDRFECPPPHKSH